MLSDTIIRNISNAKTQIYLSIFVSVFSILIILYIMYLILKNILNIFSQYNLKVKKNTKTSQNNKTNNDTASSDNYQYNNNFDDLYKQNENINKKIINTLEKANKDQTDTLSTITKLKQKLNIKDTINSTIDTKTLDDKNDDLLYYNQGGASFFSKLFYTQQK
jgi:uncharacterized protein YdcH (DUF465 family)